MLTAASGSHRPIVFLTGKGDVPTSVRAMKAGAIDFLTKPVKDQDLFDAVARAEAVDAKSRRLHSELELMQAKVRTLTPREREVLTHVVAGRLNKQIAGDLGTVEKTIKVHRSRMMEKLGVRTVADLVRMAEKLAICRNRETHLLAQGPTRRTREAAAIVFHGGNIPIHCHCGR